MHELNDLQSAAHPRANACPTCNVTLARTPCGELCTACLFEAAMIDRGGERLGPYELLQPLDEGGTGIVYIAREQGQDGLLAIKIARPELAASADALLAFRNGLRIQQSLRDQANIVGVYKVGTHDDGRPYAVMPLLNGGTLGDSDVRKRYTEPRAAIALMTKVATAVHAAHQRGILHCDLKPANILFNGNEPFVSDFGMARVVGRSDIERGAGFQGGTPGWMSPEQDQQGDLTIASDVFALGVLLYWLLAGELPFGDRQDFARRVARGAPHALRAQPSTDLRFVLGRISARAMNPIPERRYRSAAEFVDDLERARRGHSIEEELRMPVRRTLRWIRRHNVAAFAAMELVLVLLYLPLMPLSVFGDIKGALRNQITYASQAQAGAVIGELRAAARRLEQLALEPQINALVDWHDPKATPADLGSRATGFDGLSVFNAGGVLRARWPAAVFPHPTLDFSFRDYFRGQRRLADAGRTDVYVARAYHATGDEVPVLGLSTPLYQDGNYIGAFLGSTRARSTFGAVQMNCGARGSCMTALLGSRDRNYGEVEMPRSILVLAEPGLRDGEERTLDAETANRLCARFDCQPALINQFDPPTHANPLVIDDYKDPISRTHSMAAVAPVGRTGLFVVVATPLDALDAVMTRMADRVKAFIWVPLLAGLVLLAAVMAWPFLAARVRRAGLSARELG
jgi:hypothetical protein